MRFILAAFLFLSNVAFCQSSDPSAAMGIESITGTDLRKHLFILASDSMAGRETSMPGQQKAARYIAGEFQRLGLKPMGDSNSFFQRYDVEVSRINYVSSFLTINGATTPWGNGYLSTSLKETTITAPVAFVGYTDNKLDPAMKQKIAGHIIVSILGPRNRAADTTSEGFMGKLFATRRDSGSFVLMTITEDTGRASFDAIATTLGSFGMDKGQMRLKGAAGGGFQQQLLRVYLSPTRAEELLKGSGMTVATLRAKALADSAFTPVFLKNAAVTIANSVIRETRVAENVVGFLEGSDPVFKDQVVVYTAHFDHLGSNASGVIFYGADDDGSGTSTVLEIAEAYAANPVKPKRSVLFMTVSGEEKGLLGSSYYVQHPILPLDKTAANLNTDMVGRIGYSYQKKSDENYVYVIGSDKISKELDSLLTSSNAETVNLHLDYTYNDENDPNRFYFRSDHYNFAKNGIPVVFFFTGEHQDYHKPSDTPDKILYDRMARIGRLIYYTGWKVAQLDHPLAKNPAK